MTEADLLRALRDCYEPSLRRDIVSLGLIQSATLSIDTNAPGVAVRGLPPRFIAHIVLRAASADEACNAQLRAQIENRLAGLAQLSRSKIEILPALFPILSERKP
jgi:metal-sulfur cluster biosynthetic enzyme